MTDIEQSTRRWDAEPQVMRAALAKHDAALRDAIEAHGGWLFKHTGDGVLAAFAAAESAIKAAIAAQREVELPVRMGICTGAVELRDGDYFGPTLNRAHRIMEAGHGGQVLVAASAAALVSGIDLADLGEYRLRDLSEPQRIYQVRAEGLRAIFPPLRTRDLALGSLPGQATALLGRDTDVAGVIALLRRSRLVTLTGVGGVGKTRLAIQVASQVIHEFPDGAWLVELAGVGDPAAVGQVVAAVLRVTTQPEKTIDQSIVASLGRRRLLLVLDNCEHLLDAAATLAASIIAHCPLVTLLATSREALRIEGERIWPVAPLDVREGICSPAVMLFAERARAVVPEFEVGDHAAAVIDICRRLDGIPLAIELAAARIRAMSPAQIRARLDERFRLLTGGSRQAPDRQQKLRNTVQWSFDLLSPAERAVLARSAVFAGGFTLEAAENVCAGADAAREEVLDLLDSLVRKSLLTVDRSGDVVRYGLLETIRQFGEEQLTAMGESDAVRHHHAHFFAESSSIHFEIWRSARQIAAYQWLDNEMDNLRAAFRWAADCEDIDTATTIASNIGDMARLRLREEAVHWPAEIVDAARRIRHRRLVVVLTWVASNEAGLFGRMSESMRYAKEAITLLDDPDFDSFAWAYTDAATAAMMMGNPEQALAWAQRGAEHPADRRDRFCMAFLATYLTLAGCGKEAMQIADYAVAAAEKTWVPISMANAHLSKARAFEEVAPEVAVAAYQQAIRIAGQSGNRITELQALVGFMILQTRAGDVEPALCTARQILGDWRGALDTAILWRGCHGLILLFERLGRAAPSATLYGALRHNFSSSRILFGVPDAILRVRAILGDAGFDEATRRGSAMELRDAIEFAFTEVQQAHTL